MLSRLKVMAQSCLYLACKAEETLRKARDVINVCYFLLHPQQPMLKIGNVRASSGGSGSVALNAEPVTAEVLGSA